MHFQPWSHDCSAGFTLRGWHTPPSGKPLLHFLHGNGYCGRVYSPLLNALCEDFDLWLCDVQGHGDSDHGGRFHGWNRSAELALEAFTAGSGDFADAPRFALGHSFGGVLSALMAANDPSLFRRLVLLDPVIYTPLVAASVALLDRTLVQGLLPLVRATRRRRTRWPSREEAFARFRGRGVFADWQDAALRAGACSPALKAFWMFSGRRSISNEAAIFSTGGKFTPPSLSPGTVNTPRRTPSRKESFSLRT